MGWHPAGLPPAPPRPLGADPGHVRTESLRMLKNWHQSFRLPEASGNCSTRIFPIYLWGWEQGHRKGVSPLPTTTHTITSPTPRSHLCL